MYFTTILRKKKNKVGTKNVVLPDGKVCSWSKTTKKRAVLYIRTFHTDKK